MDCPLMVSVTCSAIMSVLSQHRELPIRAGNANALFEVLPELFDDRNGGHRGGIAQSAKGMSQHVVRKLAHQVDILAPPQAGVVALQDLLKPGGALAAGDAPATALMRIEFHD